MRAARDIAIVLLAIVIAWAFSRALLYPALHVPDNAPVIMRPLAGFFTSWWLLRRNGGTWAALGLRAPSPWWRSAVAALAQYGTMQALSTWAVPLLAEVLRAQSQPSFLRYINGNLVAFLGWLAIGILIGGVCEELLFRGFLLNRVADLTGNRAVGVIAQALLFGSLHLYGGGFAMVHATIFALVAGAFYFVSGRNLWPLVIVHAVWNAIGIYGTYAA